MKSPQTPNEPQTLLRFSAFNLIAFVTMLAVLLAVIVPLIQSRPAEVQAVLYRTIGLSVLIALVAFVVICILRWRVERIGGPLVIRPTTVSSAKWGFVLLMTPIMIGVAVTTILAAEAVSTIDDMFIGWMMVLSEAIPICYLAHVLAMVWWNVSPFSLEVRERGLVVGSFGFVPWTSKPKLKWKRGTSQKISILNIESPKQRTMILSAADKDAVDTKLRELGCPPKPEDD